MRENLDLIGFFMLGLLGGFGHCIGMCGPFVLYISRRFGTPESSRAAILGQQSLYGFGRLVTYAAMGIAAGALGQAVDMAGSMLGFQRVASVIAGGLLIVYALLSLIDLLPFLSSTGGSLFARVAGRMRKRSPNNALLTGILLGFLPCGLVYSAVIAAAAQGGAVKGGIGLLLFGLGTLPAMLGLSMVDELLARHRNLINKLSIVFLLVMGGWFVWQGVRAG
jgi:uncharacterized protein